MSQELLKKLAQLELPIPPVLEAALGYPDRGGAKFVAFYWSPAGDEACFDDGQLSGTGEYEGYLFYTQHPAIQPKLKAYDFGSSDNYGKQQLLLDRELRQLYAGTNEVVNQILFQQWQGVGQKLGGAEAGPLNPAFEVKSFQEVEQLLTGFVEIEPPTKEQIAAYRTQRRQIMNGLAEWLAAAIGLK